MEDQLSSCVSSEASVLDATTSRIISKIPQEQLSPCIMSYVAVSGFMMMQSSHRNWSSLLSRQGGTVV